MIILDAHLSPGLAPWIISNFDCECSSEQFLNLRHSSGKFLSANLINAFTLLQTSDLVEITGC